jgi:hypothetical protein
MSLAFLAPEDPMAATPRADNRDLFRYDQAILRQLNRLEDATTKFALRNYVTSGLVGAAFFATKIPLWAASLVVLVLNVNFVLAIAANVWRYKILCSMHEVTRNAWFELTPRSSVYEALKGDLRKLSVSGDRRWREQLDFRHPAVYANFVPLAAAVFLLLLQLCGVPLR